jgi:hypothetical protein
LSSGSVASWLAGVRPIFKGAFYKSTSFWGTIRFPTQPYSTSVPVCPHDRPAGVGATLWPRQGHARRKTTLVSIRVGPGLPGQGRHSNIRPRSPSQSRPLQGPASVAIEGSRKRAQLRQGRRHCCGSAGALFGAGRAWPGPSAGHWARLQVPARDAAARGILHEPAWRGTAAPLTSTRPIWMVRVAAGRLRLRLAPILEGPIGPRAIRVRAPKSGDQNGPNSSSKPCKNS